MKTVQLPLGLNGRPDAQTAAWYFAYVRYPDWPKSQDRRMSLVKSALVLVSGGKTQPEFGEVQPVRVKSRLEIAANVIVRERIAAAWAAYQRLRERPRPDPRQPRRMQDELRRALIKPRDTAFEQVIAGLPSISNVESFRRRIWYSSAGRPVVRTRLGDMGG
jgi:hypothetical protein